MQAGIQFAEDGSQVHHIVGSVIQLRIAERAAQPIGTGLALGQGHAGDFLHQFLVAHASAQAA
jgi:hypothetical protein